MQWSIISAVNDEQVLKTCLLDSPDVQSAFEIILQRGFASASLAYNDAIKRAKTDLLVFAHQDMFFPGGWIESVQRAIELLAVRDPDWGVLGVWGAVDSKRRVGCLIDTASFHNYNLEDAVDPERRMRSFSLTGNLEGGRPFDGVKDVVSLDEVVLIFRKSSGLAFDVRLPGYHLYGADICQEARRRGRKNYTISAFCIHNTSKGGMLPLQFWKCYLFMRSKWKQSLPIETPCTTISFSCWPILHWNLVYIRDWTLGRRRKLARIARPAELYRQLSACGLILPVREQIRTPVSTGKRKATSGYSTAKELLP